MDNTMNFADRISRLGAETAFAVSIEAAAVAAKGIKVYPFHLGDLNLRTSQIVVKGAFKAIEAGKTGYCSNMGIAPLREALAKDINQSHGTDYTMQNVLVQPGGKPVIAKFFLAMLNPGDEALYPSPGYPIYETQIEFNGGKPLPYSFIEGKDNFELNLEAMEKSITPKTRFLVFNDVHNPTGAETSTKELERLAEIVRKNNLFVLCDEAYFDMRYEGKSHSLVSLPGMKERCVILYTFSKKYAMTGWRLGAAIGPKDVIDVMGKLAVADESCSNQFVQYAAIDGLTGDQSEVAAMLAVLKERRDVAVKMLNDIKGVRCIKPNGTFYLYPNVTEAMKRKGFEDYNEFRRDALNKTGVSFCQRTHFGKVVPGEKEKYIRFAYSGINTPDIKEGLAKFKDYLEK